MGISADCDCGADRREAREFGDQPPDLDLGIGAVTARLAAGADTLTTDRDAFAVKVGERWYVEDITGNGWITLIKQHSTGLNCWDDVAGDTRKVRSKPWPVRRITCAGAFHHRERIGW